ncbi:MAG: MFS transporter [Actinomycetota bacterium]|nr:MFS transporter [Actinomycetota bacterium]MDH5223470.1 MFS transporter [Actinomycetota bacterium]MDH5312524.1 MFS transporter [Actinomycetota bacterium]
MEAPEAADGGTEPAWFNPGVRSVGLASFFSDVGHEIPTSLLPSFLTSTLGAPASVLGLIEGIADGAAGVAKLAGGALADDPTRRSKVAVGGYITTAVLSSSIGFATAPWQVAVLRTGAWAARGVRGPSRNAILADVVSPEAYGRAYGFERAADNMGAIIGPLLAIPLIAFVGLRRAMILSIVPGLLAALAMLAAVRHVRRASARDRRPIRLQVRPVLRGSLGRLFAGMGAFEFGNCAATLLILRATELLEPGRGQGRSASLAVLLYVAYNLAATLTSLPAGHLGDRRGTRLVLLGGAVAFLAAYLVFAGVGASVPVLAVGFVSAGVGIGAVETAEHAAVATRAPEAIRGSAFGLLAALQSAGNLVASAVAGVLWTAFSPTVAFVWLAAWMLAAVMAFLAMPNDGARTAASATE